MTTTDQVRRQALRLSPEDRALLAKDLLESLEPSESADAVEAAWLQEIESRSEAYEAGRMKADDWQVSIERVRERLRERQQK